MKRKTIIWGAVIIVVVLLLSSVVSTYNKIVAMDESVAGAWANVETQYQRRADLIPNLVNTVKGYAEHESETLESVVAARSKASQVTIDRENLSQEAIMQYQQAQGEVSSALGRLLMVVERYPDLKANQNFLELQAQLEGTENRISTERRKFNEDVRTYNSYIRKFPANILAGMFDFESKPYFEAAEGSDAAPEVVF